MTDPEPFADYDLSVTWRVHREGSQIITWAGEVLNLADDADDENGTPVGEMYAYLAPLALERESTYDEFDAISADLDMVAASLCPGSAALDWNLVKKYGNPNASGGLLIIDHFTLVPVARKRGALPIVLGELLYAMPDLHLLACYPHPIGGPEESVRSGQERLARHWQAHGFAPLPDGSGVHVANPDTVWDLIGRPDLDFY